ncbi:hypothetical protein M0805_007916 [Coniferiporia weirii]|nr:hypothetical protein M0805_007916 [Coniferiporia weirii]
MSLTYFPVRTPEYLLAIVLLFVSVSLVRKGKPSSLPLPPGPPAGPLTGHARKIPRTQAWKTFADWGKRYGDVVYAGGLGRSMLIVNSIAAARDLMEKRSTIFSDRPYIPVMNLMGWGLTLPLLPYGDRFRKHRRMMQKHFGQQAITSFRPMQEDEVRKFLRHLLAKPENFLGHIHRLLAGIIVLITYGHEVVPDDDALVGLVERALYLTASAGSAGTTPIDLFPFLRHIPAWLPGMGLKRFALDVGRLVERVMVVPFTDAKTNRAAGTARPCIVTKLLDEYEVMGAIDPEHEEDMMAFAAAIYNAGTDTTKSTLTTFFMMMILHPEVAKRAQEEIDNVVGTKRLPTLDDRQNLPYIDCIMKEVFRAYPPVPLGIPHQSTHTETYRGWTIPGGSMVVPNIWQMMRDEKHYTDPEIFAPERHARVTTTGSNSVPTGGRLSGDNGRAAEDDPTSIVFGFGRRVCPGKHFVDSMLWIVLANVLASFDIKPYEDPVTGIAELPTCEFENEAIRSPKAFRCSIVPRSAKHAQLILGDNHK